MNGNVTRVCPYCAEGISTAARVCPRCRQWLAPFSLRSPAIFLIAVCVWMLVFTVVMEISLKQVLSPGLDFSPYRDSISVVDSRMTFGTDDKGPVVYVVTVITNKSDLAWKEVEVDATFFDKTGKLVDAQPWRDYSIIWPHGDAAFRIPVKPIHDLSEYQSCKVYVRSARDVHARF